MDETLDIWKGESISRIKMLSVLPKSVISANHPTSSFQ